MALTSGVIWIMAMVFYSFLFAFIGKKRAVGKVAISRVGDKALTRRGKESQPERPE